MANTGAGKIQAIEDEQLKIENDTTELVLEFEKKMIRELRSQYEQATIEVQAQVQGSTSGGTVAEEVQAQVQAQGRAIHECMDGVERLAADCNSAMDKLEARVGETVDRCAIDASSIKLKLLSYVICISRPAVGLTVVALLWCVCTSHIYIYLLC